MEICHPQHLMDLCVILDWSEFETGADKCFATACFFYAMEPYIGIEVAIADEVEKVV